MLAGLGLVLLGSCAGAPAPIMPARPVVAAAQPRPVASPAAMPVRWLDAPATPGNWQFAREGGRSLARFAGGELVLSCDRAARSVSILRLGPAGEHVPLTVLTTSGTRPFSAEPVPGAPGYVGIALDPRDPLLDAIAFSRGRFAIDVAGAAPLFVPSWTETSRVIEDCR